MSNPSSQPKQPSLYSITVRDKGEYGEFFVSEREPSTRNDGSLDYSATWTCYSSFGVFGHHWSSMGEPFPKFVQGTEQDYLLGKIAEKERSTKVLCDSIRAEINRLLAEDEISKETAEEAIESVTMIEHEHDQSPGMAMNELYEDSDLERCHIDFLEGDIETTAYPQQAVAFVERLWPKFVAAVLERAK